MTDEKNSGPPEGGKQPDKDSELWRKIDSEAEMLRKRTTPSYLKQQILDSLPEEPPKPWYQRILRRD